MAMPEGEGRDCFFCGAKTATIHTKLNSRGRCRRRECTKCGEKFNTIEILDDAVKSINVSRLPRKINNWILSESKGSSIEDVIRSILVDAYYEENGDD